MNATCMPNITSNVTARSHTCTRMPRPTVLQFVCQLSLLRCWHRNRCQQTVEVNDRPRPYLSIGVLAASTDRGGSRVSISLSPQTGGGRIAQLQARPWGVDSAARRRTARSQYGVMNGAPCFDRARGPPMSRAPVVRVAGRRCRENWVAGSQRPTAAGGRGGGVGFGHRSVPRVRRVRWQSADG